MYQDIHIIAYVKTHKKNIIIHCVKSYLLYSRMNTRPFNCMWIVNIENFAIDRNRCI